MCVYKCVSVCVCVAVALLLQAPALPVVLVRWIFLANCQNCLISGVRDKARTRERRVWVTRDETCLCVTLRCVFMSHWHVCLCRIEMCRVEMCHASHIQMSLCHVEVCLYVTLARVSMSHGDVSRKSNFRCVSVSRWGVSLCHIEMCVYVALRCVALRCVTWVTFQMGLGDPRWDVSLCHVEVCLYVTLRCVSMSHWDMSHWDVSRESHFRCVTWVTFQMCLCMPVSVSRVSWGDIYTYVYLVTTPHDTHFNSVSWGVCHEECVMRSVSCVMRSRDEMYRYVTLRCVTLRCVSVSRWGVSLCHIETCLCVTLRCVSMSHWDVSHCHVEVCLYVTLRCVSVSRWGVSLCHIEMCLYVTLRCVAWRCVTLRRVKLVTLGRVSVCLSLCVMLRCVTVCHVEMCQHCEVYCIDPCVLV